MEKVDGRNTRAVKKMLANQHKSQTRTVFGWEPDKGNSTGISKEAALKNVGDTWEEYKNGKLVAIWEQKEDFRVKHRPDWTPESAKKRQELLDHFYSYPNCYDDCKTEMKDRLDEKFRRLSGMCADCHFRMEERMKLNGEYEDYIKGKMYKNAIDWFKDADVEIYKFAEQMKGGYTYTNENGSYETWEDGTDPDTMIKEYEELKQETLDKLNPDK